MNHLLKETLAPLAAMIIGYAAILYAYSQGWGELVPEEARIPIWLMAPALAGVLAVWKKGA